MSRGNRLFPTQVLITPTSVVHHTPQWIGRYEQSIHMAHMASVTIDTGLLFSDVRIETTGGANAIHCRGHRKGEAVGMKTSSSATRRITTAGLAARARPASCGLA